MDSLLEIYDKHKVAVILVILFILGFLVGIILFQKKQQPSTPAGTKPPVVVTVGQQPIVTPTPRPAASLTILPSTKIVKVGDAFPISVNIAGEAVEAVDVVLNYDPKVFTPSNIVQGKAFSKLLMKKIDNGKIIVSASLDPDKPKLSTSFGEIFSVSFKAIVAAPSSTVDFDFTQTIVAKGGVNVLGLTGKGTYTVNP